MTEKEKMLAGRIYVMSLINCGHPGLRILHGGASDGCRAEKSGIGVCTADYRGEQCLDWRRRTGDAGSDHWKQRGDRRRKRRDKGYPRQFGGRGESLPRDTDNQ